MSKKINVELEVDNDLKSEKVVEPVTTKEKPQSKEKHSDTIDFRGRGFSSIEDAIAFVDTEYFKGIGKEDQEEYLNWLKK